MERKGMRENPRYWQKRFITASLGLGLSLVSCLASSLPAGKKILLTVNGERYLAQPTTLSLEVSGLKRSFLIKNNLLTTSSVKNRIYTPDDKIIRLFPAQFMIEKHLFEIIPKDPIDHFLLYIITNEATNSHVSNITKIIQSASVKEI